STVDLTLTLNATSRRLFPTSFFFQSSADHRDLHSFPTRRSSDLLFSCEELTHILRAWEAQGRTVLAAVHDLELARRAFTHGVLRSEEHTSELQSPYDLVCRLLLEKKKKTHKPLTIDRRTTPRPPA